MSQVLFTEIYEIESTENEPSIDLFQAEAKQMSLNWGGIRNQTRVEKTDGKTKLISNIVCSNTYLLLIIICLVSIFASFISSFTSKFDFPYNPVTNAAVFSLGIILSKIIYNIIRSSWSRKPDLLALTDENIKNISIKNAWTVAILLCGSLLHFYMYFFHKLHLVYILAMIAVISQYMYLELLYNFAPLKAESFRYVFGILRLSPLILPVVVIIILMVFKPVFAYSMKFSDTIYIQLFFGGYSVFSTIILFILPLILIMIYELWVVFWNNTVSIFIKYTYSVPKQPLESESQYKIFLINYIIIILSLLFASIVSIVSIIEYFINLEFLFFGLIINEGILSLVALLDSLIVASLIPRSFAIGILGLVFISPVLLFGVVWVGEMWETNKKRRRLFSKAARIHDLPVHDPVPVYRLPKDEECQAITMVNLRKQTSAIFIREDLLALSDDEIEGVYRHEEYHIKNRHNWYSKILKILDVFGGWYSVLPLVYPAIAEHEADKYAAEYVGVDTMISVLEKVEENQDRMSSSSKETRLDEKDGSLSLLKKSFTNLQWIAYTGISYRRFSHSITKRIELLQQQNDADDPVE